MPTTPQPSKSSEPLAGALPDAPAARLPLGHQVFQPDHMNDASTHSSMLRPNGSRAEHGWLYYQKPVRNYLRGLGCGDQDVDDLTHEILIKLQTYIVLNYNPSRPFRPYFKTAIRHFYFSHLRGRGGQGGRQVAMTPGIAGAACASEAEEEESQAGEDVLAAGLLDYARQMYDHFAAEASAAHEVGIQMLQAWMLGGLKQEQLATRWKLTDRQVRTHIGRAADELARWMQERLHADDLAALAALAKDKGVTLDLELADIRGLFSHLSRQKRLRALLILSLIYKRESGTTAGTP